MLKIAQQQQQHDDDDDILPDSTTNWLDTSTPI